MTTPTTKDTAKVFGIFATFVGAGICVAITINGVSGASYRSDREDACHALVGNQALRGSELSPRAFQRCYDEYDQQTCATHESGYTHADCNRFEKRS
jgi:hypothetical protein